MDDDGKLYLYTGFALQGNPLLLDGSKPTEHGAMCFELDPADMLTVKMGPKYIGIASEKEAPGSSYEGHPFLEASSMRKFNGTYYFIYSSLNSHELCYATSDNPTEGFEFGGVLVSNGDIGLSGIYRCEKCKKLHRKHSRKSDRDQWKLLCFFITDTVTVSSLPVRPVQSASASRMANSIRQR